MKEIANIIDFSAWTGSWPFTNLPCKELDVLKKRLQSQNIVKAFVAPIEGILERDPMRADKMLLECINDEFFSPVLIVDLSFGNWKEVVDLAVKDGRVKMLKLLPNYHMYDFNENNLKPLVELTTKHNLLISLQVRIEDARGQYPLMKIPDVDVFNAAKTISYFPQQTFILNSLYIPELAPVLNYLDNVYVDISSLEKQDVLESLNSIYTLDKFLFSSHSAFYYPEGNIYKMKYSRLDADVINKVANANGSKLLGCGNSCRNI